MTQRVESDARRDQTTRDEPAAAVSSGDRLGVFRKSLQAMSYDEGRAALTPGGAAERSLQPAAPTEVAAQGTSGGAGPLPHADRIQRSFGRHDVSGIEAHTGGAAASAASALGAEAYATGNKVAFQSAPSLHTAAHEAAHVVQQRAGVQLEGGLGRSGDDYERNADAVADRVVSGESAEALLDTFAPQPAASGAGTPAVQRKGGHGLGNKEEGEDGDEVPSQQQALVLLSHYQQNLRLLSSIFAQLPARVQKYLMWLKGQLERKGEHDVRALVLRHRDEPLVQVLSIDPSVFATVLLGLKLMPESEPLPKSAPQIRDLFLTLATSTFTFDRALPMLENGDAVEVEARSGGGVEHVQNSCYAASLLNLIAAVPAYRRMFDPLVNRTQEGSEARLLQVTIGPMLQTLRGNETVPAKQVRHLLGVLDSLGLLVGGVTQQQDASQVLMAILQRIMPGDRLLETSEAVVYDDPLQAPQYNRMQETVLQLTAVGHATLEEALESYFVTRERRDGVGIANPHERTRRATSFPEVLSIGMLRQSGRDHIDMPEVFRLPASVTGTRRPGPRYRLQAFIVRNTFSHHEGGHYVAVMRDGHGGWVESDDMGKGKSGEEGVMSPRTRQVDVGSHRMGGHSAPSYALATLYTYVLDADQDSDDERTSFDSAWTLHEDILSELIFSRSKKLELPEIKERERLTREFLKKGGSDWDAYEVLKRVDDNKELAGVYDLMLRRDKPKIDKSREEIDQSGLYDIYDGMQTDELIELAGHFDKHADGNESAQLQLATVRLILEGRQGIVRGGEFETYYFDKNEAGTRIEFQATGNVLGRSKKLDAWTRGVAKAILGSRFIAERQPPLVIRIRLRPTVTNDIACTTSDGNRVTVNLDDYQVEAFSVGQTVGLLAHEVGVHSLDSSTLTPEELEAEAKDAKSKQTGKHGGKTRTIVADPKLAKQQADHLTIGRGVLGQLSALPRLNMYEDTLISLIEAMDDPQDRSHAAAAYCIDIARILVTNDDPTAMMSSNWTKLQGAIDIAQAAAAEWQRILAKHGEAHPALRKIKIDALYITSCLFTLAKLLDKVNSESSKKDKDKKK